MPKVALFLYMNCCRVEKGANVGAQHLVCSYDHSFLAISRRPLPSECNRADTGATLRCTHRRSCAKSLDLTDYVK